MLQAPGKELGRSRGCNYRCKLKTMTRAISGRITAAGIASLFAVLRMAAQSSRTVFEPLEQWKGAVLVGDDAKLKSLYVTSPGAYVQSPAGKSSALATEEADFGWGCTPRD